MNKLPERIAHIFFNANDSDEQRLQKRLMLGGSLILIYAGLIWGLMYLAFGEIITGIIPLGYSVVSSFSIVLFALTRRFRLFRFFQLILILLLPWLLMIYLGGFIDSSVVILWSLVCPLSALIIDNPKRAPLWFFAYMGLIVISPFLQPYISTSNNLSSSVIQLFFVMNISAVSGTVFVLLYYFVRQKNKLQESLKTLTERDELTGIYNRRGFFSLSELILKMSKRHMKGIYMLYADVDNLKRINDTIGHKEGDNALIDFADILIRTYRASDVIARLGGDEFAVIPVGSAGDSVESIQNRLQNNIDAYNENINRKYKLSASAGIVYFDPDIPCSMDDLLTEADKLMYEQKRRRNIS